LIEPSRLWAKPEFFWSSRAGFEPSPNFFKRAEPDSSRAGIFSNEPSRNFFVRSEPEKFQASRPIYISLRVICKKDVMILWGGCDET
jgi:hypothetical protein